MTVRHRWEPTGRTGTAARRHGGTAPGAALLAEEGQALIASLVLLAVLTLTATALAAAAALRVQAARLEAGRLAAADAADSGMELALARLGDLWRRWAEACAGKTDCSPADAPAALRTSPLSASFDVPGGPAGFQAATAIHTPDANPSPDQRAYRVDVPASGAGAPGSGLPVTGRARAVADSPFRFLLLARGEISVTQTLLLPAVLVQGHVRAGSTIQANGLAISFPNVNDVHGKPVEKTESLAVPLWEAGNAAYAGRLPTAASCPPAGILTQAVLDADSGGGTRDVLYPCNLIILAGEAITVPAGRLLAVEGDLTVSGTVNLPAGSILYVRRPQADRVCLDTRGNLTALAGSSVAGDGAVVVGRDATLTQTETALLRLYAVKDCAGDEDQAVSIGEVKLAAVGSRRFGRLYLYTDPCPADPTGSRCSISVSGLTLVGLVTSATIRGSLVSGGNVSLSFTGLNVGTVSVEYDPGMWRALPGGVEPAGAFQVLRWRGG